MSVKKSSKLDLLVRVRYANPLPPPPCAPKLLTIPTDPLRYATPAFLNALAADTPLPMIVDAECGMPLDLSQWPCLWDEDADDSELNPDPSAPPRLDPQDAALLLDPAAPAPSSLSLNASVGNVNSGAVPAQHVTWLRKTEYISREGVQRVGSHEQKFEQSAVIDVSRQAQLRDIAASFAACNDGFDDDFDDNEGALNSLTHPNKPGVRAVASYPFLPDAEVWANQYDLFRFSERPGEKALEVDDPRLDCAVLRPMKTAHDSFLAYYLTQNDESAVQFKQIRAELPPYGVADTDEKTVFQFIRDYETVKVEQEVPNEFLLVLDDGMPPSYKQSIDDSSENRTPAHPVRERGAYYKNIERKMHLKKKRANAYDQYEDKWEIIRLQHAPMSAEEEEERREALEEVCDPLYPLQRDLDAEGELEDVM